VRFFFAVQLELESREKICDYRVSDIEAHGGALLKFDYPGDPDISH
jgi:hypothetical protein